MTCGRPGKNFVSVYVIAASFVRFLFFFSQKYDFSLLTNSRSFPLSLPFDLNYLLTV